ncbi:MAG TPA: hypothetical protein PLO27_07620 [Marmoricola sp.]|nr:hypothetical protein [Marmoricola sp.]
MEWANSVAALDPAISQAIATISGALAMLIISMASYYFPKGRSKHEDDMEEHDHKKHNHDQEEDDVH